MYGGGVVGGGYLGVKVEIGIDRLVEGLIWDEKFSK